MDQPHTSLMVHFVEYHREYKNIENAVEYDTIVLEKLFNITFKR